MSDQPTKQTFDLEAFRAKRDAGIQSQTLWAASTFEIRQSREAGERDLRYANLSAANLSAADLSAADLSAANLSDANLRAANLSAANLSAANLRDANLSDANLSDANLRDANLRAADLSAADLSAANLRDANLSAADLRDADLRDANLSAAKGLLSPINYLEENFEATAEGYIVYKTFNSAFPAPASWVIEANSIITEVVNPTMTMNSASGINVAPLAWVKKNYPEQPIWKCLIEWKWLVGVTVPYMTNGKIRAEKVRLIEIVKE